MHGLIFKTSVWLLAESTRLLTRHTRGFQSTPPSCATDSTRSWNWTSLGLGRSCITNRCTKPAHLLHRPKTRPTTIPLELNDWYHQLKSETIKIWQKLPWNSGIPPASLPHPNTRPKTAYEPTHWYQHPKSETIEIWQKLPTKLRYTKPVVIASSQYKTNISFWTNRAQRIMGDCPP